MFHKVVGIVILALAIFTLQGNPAHLEIYISSFSFTGSQIKNTNFIAALLFGFWHVVSSKDADELQIVRIMVAQIKKETEKLKTARGGVKKCMFGRRGKWSLRQI